MPEPNSIYSFLKENKLTTKTEEEFLKEYSTREKSDELHGFFVKNNLTTKPSTDFYKEYFQPKSNTVATPKAPPQNTPLSKPTPSATTPAVKPKPQPQPTFDKGIYQTPPSEMLSKVTPDMLVNQSNYAVSDNAKAVIPLADKTTKTVSAPSAPVAAPVSDETKAYNNYLNYREGTQQKITQTNAIDYQNFQNKLNSPATADLEKQKAAYSQREAYKQEFNAHQKFSTALSAAQNNLINRVKDVYGEDYIKGVENLIGQIGLSQKEVQPVIEQKTKELESLALQRESLVEKSKTNISNPEREKLIAEDALIMNKMNALKLEIDNVAAKHNKLQEQYKVATSNPHMKELFELEDKMAENYNNWMGLADKYPEAKEFQEMATAYQKEVDEAYKKGGSNWFEKRLFEVIRPTFRAVQNFAVGTVDLLKSIDDADLGPGGLTRKIGRTLGFDIEEPNENFDWLNKLALNANEKVEEWQAKKPSPSNLQRQAWQDYVEVGDGLKVLVKNGEAIDVRDNNWFSIPMLEKDKFLETVQKEIDSEALPVQTDYSNRVVWEQVKNTGADLGMMIYGGKLSKNLLNPITGAETATKVGTYLSIINQVHRDAKMSAKEAGLDDQDAAAYALMLAPAIAAVNMLNPLELKLVRGRPTSALSESAKISALDVAAIIKDPFSIKNIVRMKAQQFFSNGIMEMIEESGLEKLATNAVQNMYSGTANEGSGFNSELDWNETKETAAVSFVVGAFGGLLQPGEGLTPWYVKEALMKAVEKPERFTSAVRNMQMAGGITKEKADEEINRINQLKIKWDATKGNIDPENAETVLALMALKQRYEKNVTANKEGQSNIEPAVAIQQEEVVKQIDEEIKVFATPGSTEQESKFVETKATAVKAKQTQPKKSVKTITGIKKSPVTKKVEEEDVEADAAQPELETYFNEPSKTPVKDAVGKQVLYKGKIGELKIDSEGTIVVETNDKIIEVEGSNKDGSIPTGDLGIRVEIESPESMAIMEAVADKKTIEDLSDTVEGAIKGTIGNTDVIISTSGNDIVIESIKTPINERGKGSAKNAIQKIIEQADKLGKTIRLKVVPEDLLTTKEKLVEFYEKFGFESKGSEMVRKPKAIEPSKAVEVRKPQRISLNPNETVEANIASDKETRKAAEEMAVFGDPAASTETVEGLADEISKELGVKTTDTEVETDVESYFSENTRSTQDSKYNPDLSGEGEMALREQEERLLELGADRIQAHGLAKGSIGQQFKDLINILTNGLDSRGGGQLYTAPLVVPNELRAGAGSALGTGGGTAYIDGGFIILARDGINEIRSIDDIGGVLVNQAVADSLPELVDKLKKQFPNISIESYSNATKAIKSIKSSSNPTKTFVESIEGVKIEDISDVSEDAMKITSGDSEIEQGATPAVDENAIGSFQNFAGQRKAGKYLKDGVLYERQPESVTGKRGNDSTVEFAKGVDIPVKFAIIEVGTLQPSHKKRNRNPLHFIPSAQPKERSDDASTKASDDIAANPDFTKLGESPNAYSGAPIVNRRGEVIQGNNRSEGIIKHYESNGSQYKKALLENAESFGLSKDDIAAMKKPVLVRVVAVSDDAAHTLGNYDAKDIETGGQARIDPVQTGRRISREDKASIVKALFENTNLTLNQSLRDNFEKVVGFLQKYLTSAQLNSIVNKQDGGVSKKGLSDLEDLIKHFLFEGGSVSLPEQFDNLKGTVRAGIEKSMPSILGVPEEASIISIIQDAIEILGAYNASGMESVSAWASQIDMLSPKSKLEQYGAAAIKLAGMLDSKKEIDIKKLFRDYGDLVIGQEPTIFTAKIEPLTKAEAIKKLLGVEYKKSFNDKVDAVISDPIVTEEIKEEAIKIKEYENDKRTLQTPVSKVDTETKGTENEGSTEPQPKKTSSLEQKKEKLDESKSRVAESLNNLFMNSPFVKKAYGENQRQEFIEASRMLFKDIANLVQDYISYYGEKGVASFNHFLNKSIDQALREKLEELGYIDLLKKAYLGDDITSQDIELAITKKEANIAAEDESTVTMDKSIVARGKEYYRNSKILAEIEKMGTKYSVVHQDSVEPFAEKFFEELKNSPQPDAAIAAFFYDIDKTSNYDYRTNDALSTFHAQVTWKILSYYANRDVKKWSKWFNWLDTTARSKGRFNAALDESSTGDAIANRALKEILVDKPKILKTKQENGKTPQQEINEVREGVKTTEEEVDRAVSSDAVENVINKVVNKRKTPEEKLDSAKQKRVDGIALFKQGYKDLMGGASTTGGLTAIIIPIPINQKMIQGAAMIVQSYIQQGIVNLTQIKRRFAVDLKGFNVDRAELLEKAIDEAGVRDQIDTTKPPKANMTVKEAIRDTEKKLGEQIREVIKKSYKQQSDYADALVTRLIQDAGLTGVDAYLVANAVKAEIAKQTTQRKKEFLSKHFKLAGTPIAPARKAKSKIDKIIELSNMGALGDPIFTPLFAQKYGYTPLSINDADFINNAIQQIQKYKGEMSQRIRQDLLNYLKNKEPWHSKKIFEFLESWTIRAALTGVMTLAVNIPVGSTLSAGVNMLLKSIANPLATVSAFKVLKEKSQLATGINSVRDIMSSDFNVMDSLGTFVGESEIKSGNVTKEIIQNTFGKALNQAKNGKTAKDRAVGMAKLLTVGPFTKILQISNWAKAFDAIINHPLGEAINFIEEWNKAMQEEGLTSVPFGKKSSIKNASKLIEDTKKRMGYDTLTYNDAVDQASQEITDMQADGIKIPLGYKGRRIKEILFESRNIEVTKKAYETIKAFGLMGKPMGFAGWGYEKFMERTTYKDDEAVANTFKFLNRVTFGLFLRIATAGFNMAYEFTPIIGLTFATHRFEPKEIDDAKGKRRVWQMQRRPAKETARILSQQAAVISGSLLLLAQMFDYDDEEDRLKLDPNRKIDITLSGTGEYWDADVMQYKTESGELKKHRPIAIRYKKDNGEWTKWVSLKHALPLAPMIALLGGVRDDHYLRAEDLVGRTNAESIIETLNDGMEMLSTFSFNSNAQAINDIVKGAQYGGFVGVSENIIKTFARPLKTAMMPNVYRDMFNEAKAGMGTNIKTGGKLERAFIKDLYLVDLMFMDENEVDRFGNEVFKQTKFKFIPELMYDDFAAKNEYRFDKPHWQLALKYEGANIPDAYFATKATAKRVNDFNPRYKQMSVKEAQRAFSRDVNILWGQFIDTNYDQLNKLDKQTLELILPYIKSLAVRAVDGKEEYSDATGTRNYYGVNDKIFNKIYSIQEKLLEESAENE